METCPPPSVISLPDFITLCSCYKIPYLSPLLYNDEVFLTLKCECKKIKDFKLSDYLIENKNIYNSMEKCNNCEKKITNYYCLECKQFLCEDCCMVNHNKHYKDIIDISNFNSICFEHKKKFIFFCQQCKKNICSDCDHNNHNILQFQQFPEEFILKIKRQIDESKRYLEELNNSIRELNNKLKRIYNLYSAQCEFLNHLFILYDNFIQRNQNNYHMQKNLFKFYNIIYDRYPKINIILNKTKKLFKLLDNSYTNISNIKTKYTIKHIELLSNGKLGYCCENSRILNILQIHNLQIKKKYFQTTKNINYFKELKNKNIIVLYYDKSMEIISIENDPYVIIQTFQSDLLLIQKIIELKKVLLSFTSNNEIQIWEKKNEKYDYNTSLSFNEKSNSHKFDVFKINEKKFVISIQNTNTLIFFNEKCEKIGELSNISIWIGQNMCMLNNDILCYGGNSNKGFYLININVYQIVNVIKGPTLIYSVIKSNYGIVFASVLEKNINKINQYKFNNNNLILLSSWKNESQYFIFYLADLKKGFNAYGDVDTTIKIIANF